MIIEGIRVWLALFSRLYHSIDSWSQTGPVMYQAAENGISILCQSVDTWQFDSGMFITIVSEKQDVWQIIASISNEASTAW